VRSNELVRLPINDQSYDMHKPEVNADRLMESLARMAQIGATKKGRVCCLAATDEDRAGRDLLVT